MVLPLARSAPPRRPGPGAAQLAGLVLALATLRAAADAGPPPAPVLRVEAGAHSAPIHGASADAEGRWLATASEDKTARVWDLRTGAQVRVLRPPLGDGREGELYAVAMSPDGQLVATGGHTGLAWAGSYAVYVFERATGRMIRRLDGLRSPPASLAFSPDGRWLAASLHGIGGGIRVYRTDTFALVGEDARCGGDLPHVEFGADGRLVAASLDGFLRVYQVTVAGLGMIARGGAVDSRRPHVASLSPDGRLLAVGYADSTRVDVLDAKTLDGRVELPMRGLERGAIAAVAWSRESGRLFAAGSARRDFSTPVRSWLEGGRGGFADLPGATEAITDLRALPGDRVVFAARDPAWGVLEADGRRALLVASPIADFAAGREYPAVSADGTSVRFAYDRWGRAPARFDVRTGTLTPGGDGAGLLPPRAWGLAASGVDRAGTPVRSQPAPEHPAVAANVSGDGRLVVAALRDGTIRWYRTSDGKELLALYPHSDRRRWVLWTPGGYHAASAGGEDLLGWHVNRGPDEAADFFPVSRFHETLHRPDVVSRVLDALDEAEALRTADADAGRPPSPPASVSERLPPVVEILAPADGATFTGEAVRLRLRVRAPADAPPPTLRVRVNGRDVPVPQPGALLARAEDGIELSLPVRCEDGEIEVLAQNGSSWSTPAAVRLACAASPSP